jgi:Fe-S cluster assembly protein SufB
VTNRAYQYGFETDIEQTETIPKVLNEDVIRLISLKKQEPAFSWTFG